MLNTITAATRELTVNEQRHAENEICAVVHKNSSVIELIERNWELHEEGRKVFLLILRSKVLLENLTVGQLVKKCLPVT
jgi:hypothetical protein